MTIAKALQRAGSDRIVRIVRVGERELPQRSEPIRITWPRAMHGVRPFTRRRRRHGQRSVRSRRVQNARARRTGNQHGCRLPSPGRVLHSAQSRTGTHRTARRTIPPDSWGVRWSDEATATSADGRRHPLRCRPPAACPTPSVFPTLPLNPDAGERASSTQRLNGNCCSNTCTTSELALLPRPPCPRRRHHTVLRTT